jgi:hypothetical protein
VGWFRAIPFPHVTHSENGCRGAYKARVFATGNISSFFATNMPNPTLGPKLMFGVVLRNFVVARHPFRIFRNLMFRSKTHVWSGFAQFRCRVHRKHEFLPREQFLHFSQRTCPIHYFRSKTHVWGGCAQFRCRTSPIRKTVVGVHTKNEFLPTEPFLR